MVNDILYRLKFGFKTQTMLINFCQTIINSFSDRITDRNRSRLSGDLACLKGHVLYESKICNHGYFYPKLSKAMSGIEKSDLLAIHVKSSQVSSKR